MRWKRCASTLLTSLLGLTVIACSSGKIGGDASSAPDGAAGDGGIGGDLGTRADAAPASDGGGSDAAPIDAAAGDAAPSDAAPSDAAPSDAGPSDARLGDATVADGGGAPDAAPLGDGGLPAAWLVVRGNRIVHADGSAFHGRGANLHDERSCNACSYAPRDPAGVNRWADELIHNWHANFIRFLLSSKPAPYNQFEVQWENLIDDPQYFADIQANVAHMTANPGVYVLVTLFADPTIKENNGDYDSEWPSSLGDSNTRYAALAEAFFDNPQVLFGLTNEPHTTRDRAPELAARYQSAIAAIRAVEDAHRAPHHIVVVQAPEGWSRDLTYFVANPLAEDNIAYEVHPYNPASDFDALLVQPSQTLPIIIGEYGPAGSMTDQDIRTLWTVAQANEIPYLAWNFHQRCPPDLLQDTASDGCGLSASTGYNFPRTAWGDLLFTHLSTPW